MAGNFKLYTDKSSVLKPNSRYVQGGYTDVKETSLGWWDKNSNLNVPKNDDIIVTISKRHEYKPYMVAKAFLGREDLEWIILQYNNIVDIMEEFSYGKTIRIPSMKNLNSGILTQTLVR